ncbi:hypothetical protein M9H77_13794 [Catharanthus roseus]|uniref:Uncharacterized protein n=1 Tax=Catharanthus roseus TaxID=4058 RepID=A0ACC0BL70_CATRO|nr:hypothetical protein M9H77_13794 [Catharanthus roseus]
MERGTDDIVALRLRKKPPSTPILLRLLLAPRRGLLLFVAAWRRKHPVTVKSAAWTTAVGALRDQLGISITKTSIMSRMKTWEKHYKTLQPLLAKDSDLVVTWDSSKGRIQVNNEFLEEYVDGKYGTKRKLTSTQTLYKVLGSIADSLDKYQNYESAKATTQMVLDEVNKVVNLDDFQILKVVDLLMNDQRKFETFVGLPNYLKRQ